LRGEANPEICEVGESTENVQRPGLHNKQGYVACKQNLVHRQSSKYAMQAF
jgi:hypothetical protein